MDPILKMDKKLLTRECSSCTNTLELNMYSLNKRVCKYCEKGVEIPTYLKKNTKDNLSTNEEASYEEASYDEASIEEASIEDINNIISQ